MNGAWMPKRATGGWFVVASTMLAGALLPAPAEAACGGVKYARPAERIDPARRPPLAIGDSTMLLAVEPLARVGFEVNARGCRQMGEGLELLALRKRQHRLPRVVLIHLGANAGMTTREIQRAVRILGPRRTLAMVTPRPGPHAEVIRAAGRRFPKRLRVLDWVRHHAGHRSWFSGDGLHLSSTGVGAFVRFCRAIVALAAATEGQLVAAAARGRTLFSASAVTS